MMNAGAFQGEEHQPFWFQPEQPHGAALLVHGFPGTPAEMRSIAKVLVDNGYATEGLLLPGFGVEIDNLSEKKHQDWESAVDKALQKLQRQYNRVIVVGNSMGGSLAIQAAARHQADGLILFAPFWTIDNVLWKALPIIKHVIPRVQPFKLFKPDFNDPEFQEGTRKFVPDADFDDPDFQRQTLNFEIHTDLFAQIRQVGVRGYELAPQIKVPSLVIQGTGDDLVSPENTRKLIGRFNSAHEYIEVPAAHNPLQPNDAYWSRIVSATTAYLDKLAMTDRI